MLPNKQPDSTVKYDVSLRFYSVNNWLQTRWNQRDSNNLKWRKAFSEKMLSPPGLQVPPGGELKVWASPLGDMSAIFVSELYYLDSVCEKKRTLNFQLLKGYTDGSMDCIYSNWKKDIATCKARRIIKVWADANIEWLCCEHSTVDRRSIFRLCRSLHCARLNLNLLDKGLFSSGCVYHTNRTPALACMFHSFSLTTCL